MSRTRSPPNRSRRAAMLKRIPPAEASVVTNATFTAVFEQIPAQEGGGYHAYVEELPGAITQGDTLDEARPNLQDAIQMILEANRQLPSGIKARWARWSPCAGRT